MSISATHSGLRAIHQGYQSLNNAASQIARNSLSLPDTTGKPLEAPMTELKQSAIQAQAGAKLIEAESGMLGIFLNEHA